MKKEIVNILLLMCMVCSVHAQTDSLSTGREARCDSMSESLVDEWRYPVDGKGIPTVKAIRPTENIFRLQYGGVWAQDSYLSPLLYSGQYIGIGGEWWRNARWSGRWTNVGVLDVKGGRSYNTQYTNMIYNLGIRGGWGTTYNREWKTGAMPGLNDSRVQVFVGPYLDVDFQARELANNVNKPFSFDIGADVDVLAGVSFSMYKSRKHQSSYRLRYLVRANVIGIEWVPDYWTSYYEVSEGVNLKVGCGWPGNRQNIHQELTVDMQWRKVSWRIGIEHEYLRYGRQDMRFGRQTVGVVVGTSLTAVSSGTKL